MKNLRHETFEIIQVTNSTEEALPAGAVIQVGSLAGVVVAGIAAGATGSVRVAGDVELPKKAALEPNQGTAIFFDPDESEVTATADDGFPLGVVSVKPAAADATIRVALNVRAVAAHVADAADGSAVEINALRDALVDAGIMARNEA